MIMTISVETKLDFDRTVSTEDRFAIRKMIDRFVQSVNANSSSIYRGVFSDAVVIEGFSDLTELKENFCNDLERRFKKGDRVMRFPGLKLSYSRYLFQLEGTYEEFVNGILATEGTIALSLIKEDEAYKIVRIIFYPRMRLLETE